MAEEKGILEWLKELTDRPWLKRETYYRTRVEFGDTDHAVLVLVCGDLLERLLAAWAELAALAEAGQSEAGAAHALALRLADSESPLWRLLDEIETRAISSWDMSEWADARGQEPPPAPKDIKDAGERLRILREFVPIASHFRILYAIAWSSKKV